jgi:hypothetical protein
VPKWIDERDKSSPSPNERRRIECSGCECLVIDPTGSGGICIQEHLKATVQNKTVVVSSRTESAPHSIRRFEDVDRNARLEQPYRDDKPSHASSNNDHGILAEAVCRCRPGRIGTQSGCWMRMTNIRIQ